MDETERPLKLALFDLDKTLLPIDSDHAWGDYCVQQGWVNAADYQARNDAFYADYVAGQLDIYAYVAFATEVLALTPVPELRARQAQFMREVMHVHLHPVAHDLVRKHREDGYICVMLSATNEFVTRPLAEAFGLEHLLATELERGSDGAYTNRLRGTPNLGPGKVQRLNQWLAARGWTWANVHDSVAYSDSMNDLPLLEQAHRAVATNPDPRLRALAEERGWEILDIFEKTV